MENTFLNSYKIDYVELYTPLAKLLAYWHVQALGFDLVAEYDTSKVNGDNLSSYVVRSQDTCLVLTSVYPTQQSLGSNDVLRFLNSNFCGVKKIAILVQSVSDVFEESIQRGAFPLAFPRKYGDDYGFIEEASIKLYDASEIVFIDRSNYGDNFKPGYKSRVNTVENKSVLRAIDHIASEVRINEGAFWSNYLSKVIQIPKVQSIGSSEDNKTGMVLRVHQSIDQQLTFVIAEPENWKANAKIQHNINKFGPGIHHLAFKTDNLIDTIEEFLVRGVEFVDVPPTYYEILRQQAEFDHFDIDSLQSQGVIIDREGDSYLLQKFIRPLSDRPFFFYEIVERVNGYSGFALKNINVLKRAEELSIIKGS